MKIEYICQLDDFRLTKYGNFRRIKDNRFYYFKENCIVCNNSFMTSRKNGKFCSRKCINNFQTGSGNPFYSKHHTNKTKTKIRNKIKGNKHPLYGKHLSDETKEKIRKSKKGKTRVDISGKNHPQWKGGISCKPYCDAWADKEYKKSIKERDEYKCQNSLCKNKYSKLCIHHIDYNKENCKPINLITLCFSCNSRANFNRDFWQDHYKKIQNENR